MLILFLLTKLYETTTTAAAAAATATATAPATASEFCCGPLLRKSTGTSSPLLHADYVPVDQTI
jgi:hypothetical protein